MKKKEKYPRCCEKKCLTENRDLWAGFYYHGKYYCIPCAEKLKLIEVKAEIKCNFEKDTKLKKSKKK